MHEGKIVFSQLMEHLPLHSFRRCVDRFGGERSVKSFSCQDQFRCMAFAQLTYRESLRDTVTCLNAQRAKLYHMGIRGKVSRSTLADANERRDWRLYAAFAQTLIAEARRLYARDSFGADLANAAYALDTTTIDLCLSLFPWAKFQRTKGAVKLHTMIDLRGNIPVVVHIGDGKTHDIDLLDVIVPEPGAVYVMDRGFVDFARLYRLATAGAFFVVHATFRKVGAIHHNHYYSVILRNLSASGALVEGMLDVPLGTQFVIDLGDGQLVVATVRRSHLAQQGVEFEEELVPDGSGGLCTRHRISPYVLAAAGITQEAMKPGNEVLICAADGQLSLPAFHTVETRKQAETKAA